MNLVAYGTLMFPQVVTTLVGRSLPHESVHLQGIARCSVKDQVYPAAIEKSGSMLTGTIYFDLATTDMRKLDIYEGEHYSRRIIQVSTELHGEVEAWIFIFKEEFRYMLSESPWEPEEFERCYLKDYLRVCAAF